MARKRRKRRHPQLPRRRGPSLESILEQVHALQEQGRLEEALEVLENAPAHLQQWVELQLPRGALYLMMGNLVAATEVFEEVTRLDPDNHFATFFLAGVYHQRQWMSHAVRTTRQALRHRDSLPDDVLQEAEMLLEDIEAVIQETAVELGTSVETMEGVLYHVECAERLAEEDQFQEAARLFHQAARLVPTWLGPRNNEALFRFLSGEAEQAIRISEEVLAADADNRHALANMVRFHVTRGEREKAQAYAERLKQLPLRDPESKSKAIEALGFLHDDEGLYAIYQHHRLFIAELGGISLLILGAAAANLGHPRTARRLWREAEAAGIPSAHTEHLIAALGRKAPGPGLAPRYPTVVIPILISMRRLEEFGELMMAWEKEEIEEQRLRQQVEEFVAGDPHIVQMATKLLWEESKPQFGLEMLGFIGNADAIAEIERFAFGQAGPIGLRLRAAEILVELGAHDPSQPVQIWDEEAREWRLSRVMQWTITSDVERPPYSPQVWELIEAGTEALGDGQLDLAQEKLEAALALDPQAAVAHHNLAVIFRRRDNLEAAVEHLEQALAIDPTYVYARCTLARFYLFSKDDPDTAHAVLEPILEETIFTPEEMMYYQRTLADLAIEAEEYEAASRHVEMMLDVNPEDEIAQDLLIKVQRLEMLNSPFWQEWQAREHRREEKKRHRPTRPDATLVECLGRLTKDALIGTARAMPAPRKYNVRKALLIEDLAGFLSDPFWLRKVVAELSDEDRQALRDVLDAGGTLPRDEFIVRYDDDLDESPYWQWHEPETVMGFLRMMGLLSEGTVDGQLLVLVPYELRPLLPPLLEQEGE